MKTIEIKVFEYEELNEDAKQEALKWWLEGCMDFDWHDSTYEDAERIGLKITSFDLDRNRHAKGEFLDGPLAVAEKIISEHGDVCATYKTAQAFIKEYKPLIERLDQLQENHETFLAAEALENHMVECADEFLKDILEDYSIILQNESEYRQSRGYAEESILANAYTFTETGERFG